jgi:hypothetical protein
LAEFLSSRLKVKIAAPKEAEPAILRDVSHFLDQFMTTERPGAIELRYISPGTPNVAVFALAFAVLSEMEFALRTIQKEDEAVKRLRMRKASLSRIAVSYVNAYRKSLIDWCERKASDE